MSENNKNHFPILIGIMLALSVMIVLVIYSPTLYRLFCSVTGVGGTVNRGVTQSVNKPEDAQMPEITVRFDSNVDPALGWEFRPEQREVKVRVGKPAKIYYYAKNNTDQTIVGRAIYNVTPYKIATYFFKTECFCFTEEKLGPGEDAHMPVVFYIDKQFMKDPNVQDVKSITLSYSFFKKKDLDAAKIEAARDLKGGSKDIDDALKPDDATANFDNDAPRD